MVEFFISDRQENSVPKRKLSLMEGPAAKRAKEMEPSPFSARRPTRLSAKAKEKSKAPPGFIFSQPADQAEFTQLAKEMAYSTRKFNEFVARMLPS